MRPMPRPPDPASSEAAGSTLAAAAVGSSPLDVPDDGESVSLLDGPAVGPAELVPPDGRGVGVEAAVARGPGTAGCVGDGRGVGSPGRGVGGRGVGGVGVAPGEAVGPGVGVGVGVGVGGGGAVGVGVGVGGTCVTSIPTTCTIAFPGEPRKTAVHVPAGRLVVPVKRHPPGMDAPRVRETWSPATVTVTDGLGFVVRKLTLNVNGSPVDPGIGETAAPSRSFAAIAWCGERHSANATATSAATKGRSRAWTRAVTRMRQTSTKVLHDATGHGTGRARPGAISCVNLTPAVRYGPYAVAT